MKVAIIGGSQQHLNIVDAKLMDLIEESGNYIFTVIGGYVGECADVPLGQLWATSRGLPYVAEKYNDLGSMIRGVAAAADYIIFLYDNSPIMKRFLMTYKQTGKPGSVINIC